MKRFLQLLIPVLGLTLATDVGAEISTPPRLDRSNLLQYRSAEGHAAQGRTRLAWKKRRTEILRGMEEVMGKLPGSEKQCALDVTVESETDCGDYVLRSISYASEPGNRVPAYVMLPKAALNKRTRLPAVLALHPTELTLGPKTVAGLGGKANRDYGRELARRGYVVLAPAYPFMGGYRPDLDALGYRSTTMKAIWDNVRGMDLLESLPQVKRGRIGAIGHSLGGHNAMFTAVFDPRIQVIVSSCGFDSFLDYKDGNIEGWASKFYMPGLQRYPLEKIPFDFHEVVGALAPRPFFVNAPTGDSNFKWRSVDAVLAAARPVYCLYGKQAGVRVAHPDCGHDFPPEVRELAYRLMDETLK